MALADPDSFDERSAAADSGGRTTRHLSLIAATSLAFAALLTNTAAQPDTSSTAQGDYANFRACRP